MRISVSKDGREMFQSPRSGKFVSDPPEPVEEEVDSEAGFNPLDRGNLYQIKIKFFLLAQFYCFNPLDRGNLYQIGHPVSPILFNLLVSIP